MLKGIEINLKAGKESITFRYHDKERRYDRKNFIIDKAKVLSSMALTKKDIDNKSQEYIDFLVKRNNKKQATKDIKKQAVEMAKENLISSRLPKNIEKITEEIKTACTNFEDIIKMIVGA